MTQVLWSTPALDLITASQPTLQGLWQALFTTQNAALTLARSASVMPVGDFTEVAMDLGQGVDALEASHPELVNGASVELPLVSPIIDYAGPTQELAMMIKACVELAADLLVGTTQRLDMPELLSVTLAIQSLSDAHVRLMGRLP